MTHSPNHRRVFRLNSRPNEPVEAHCAWEDRHIASTRCPGCRRWRLDVPEEAIHAELTEQPRSIITTTGLFGVVWVELIELLRPHGDGLLIGSVRLAGSNEPLSRWATIHGTVRRILEIDRGRYSRHEQCRVCGSIDRRNWWAHPVIVERDLDDRWFYLSRYDDFIVDERLIVQERLKERFPTLRCYPIPIVPEPLDGEVLPGDPGWTGTFIKTPLPKPPDTKPERGIGLWL